jgi:hypothetical protein
MKWGSWFSQGNAVSPELAFWKWFTENETELLDFEADRVLERERLSDWLRAQLKWISD